MLILIGADGNSAESAVAKRFGHADYLIIYDSISKEYETFPNNEESQDHKNLSQYPDKGVEAFIVGNIGPHAFKIISTSKSKVYLARKMSVRESIVKFLKGELKILTEPTAKRSPGHENG